MKLATTLQFRKAVRKVAAKMDKDLGDSWTNGSTVPGRRTVGFVCYGASSEMVRKIEKKLNKKGLTAQTRVIDSSSHGYYNSGALYIRGTCVLAK